MTPVHTDEHEADGPLILTDGKGINFNADCADLVYMLRAYYAWKNGLPFSYVTGVYSRGGGDFRRPDPRRDRPLVRRPRDG